MGFPNVTITPTGVSPITLVDENQTTAAPYNPNSVTSITAAKSGGNLQIKLADSTGNNFVTLQFGAPVISWQTMQAFTWTDLQRYSWSSLPSQPGAAMDDLQLLIDSLQKARAYAPSAPGTSSLANTTISWTGTQFNPTFVESWKDATGNLIVILGDGTNSLQFTAKSSDDFDLLLDQIQVEGRHRIL